MRYLAPIPLQYVDQSGIPYSGGTVSVYYAGNDTLAPIYENSHDDELATNPAVLDSIGMWKAFVDAGVSLDYIVKNDEGNVVASFLGVVAAGGNGGGTGGVTKAYVDENDNEIRTSVDNLAADVANEVARAEAAEKAAKTEVVAGENVTVEEIIAPDGHSIFEVSSDGTPQQQSNWTQQDPSEPDYIKNKPTKLSDFTDDVTRQSLVESGVGIEKPVSSAAVNAGLSEKADKVQGAIAGNLAALDASGNLTDSGKNSADFATAEQGDKADSAVQGVKVNGTELSKDGNNVVDVPVPTSSTATPLKDGTASAGSATTWSKSDHVHPTDTSREATANKDTSIPTTPTEGHYPTTGAVKDFVNSSVSTNTANFLGTYDVVTDLGLTTSATNTQIASALNSYTFPAGTTVTNNDYVFVSINYSTTTDVDEFRRFKYSTGTPNGSWSYEYTLNNSSYTQAQWDAINSGATATKIGNYDSHLSDTSNPHSVTKSQVGLGNVGNFKAVSTEAGQGLNSTEQGNARTNIGAGTYTKDVNGIPKTDLASGVQTSLGLADTAYQKPSGGIPDSDIASASTWSGKQDSLGINSSTGDANKFLNQKGAWANASVSVTDNNPTLSWNTTSKVGTVGNTDLRVTLPANPADSKAQYGALEGYGMTSGTQGYSILAQLTYSNVNAVYAGVMLGIVARGGGGTFEAILSVSLSEYGSGGNETGAIKGNVTILNSRGSLTDVTDRFDFYVLRIEPGKYEIYVQKKAGSLPVSCTIISSTECDIILYNSPGAIANLPAAVETTKLGILHNQYASSITSGTFDAARIPTSLPDVNVGTASRINNFVGSAAVTSNDKTYQLIARFTSRAYTRFSLKLMVGGETGRGCSILFITVERNTNSDGLPGIVVSNVGNRSYAGGTQYGMEYTFDSTNNYLYLYGVTYAGIPMNPILLDDTSKNPTLMTFYHSSDSITAPSNTTVLSINVPASVHLDTQVGSTTTPVYVGSNGSLNPCNFQINFGTPIAGTNVLNIVT